MKETFEEYLQRLKDRRTEDDYKYTDEDFKNRIHYIFDCYEKDLSVYKCLEFMYFVEREIKAEDVFNDQKKESLKEFINKHKQETLEEAVDKASLLEFPIKEWYRSGDYSREEITAARDGFKRGAKWQAERMYSEEEVNSIIAEAWNSCEDNEGDETFTQARDRILNQYKPKQEQHNFLPGLIKQFDPKEGEINGEEWTAVHFLKWLELNKFKIIK